MRVIRLFNNGILCFSTLPQYFPPPEMILQANHYLLYLVNVYLEMIHTNGLPLGWIIFCGDVRFASFRWYLFSETTCFMDHQTFIFSSEAGVKLVQSLGKLTEMYFSMPNCLDLIVIKSKLQKHRKIADTNHMSGGSRCCLYLRSLIN